MKKEGVLFLTEHPREWDRWKPRATALWDWLPASTPQQANEVIQERQPNVGIVDCRTRNMHQFLNWHQEILRANGHIHWVAVVSPQHLQDPAFSSYLSTHFFAYQSEPFCPDRMVAVLASAGDMAKLRLKRRTPTEIQGLIGNSSGIQTLSGQISRSADAGYPILITGEVGSGKSAAAKAIHLCSRRRDQTLRKIRSIAFPTALPPRVELPHPVPAQHVELCDDSAILEAAEFGTLVLDEIGDLSHAAQRTLLQLLARTGRKIHLVALTHMDLSKAVAENRFRADLLQKLSEVHLVTPPLRERGDDVLLLAQHFLTSFWNLNRHISGFSDAAMHAMQQHTWPGNVRELRCRVRRGMLMSDDRLVHREDLGLGLQAMKSSSRGL